MHQKTLVGTKRSARPVLRACALFSSPSLTLCCELPVVLIPSVRPSTQHKVYLARGEVEKYKRALMTYGRHTPGSVFFIEPVVRHPPFPPFVSFG